MTGHRSFRQLANALAACGYPTLRFDYPGTGDSADPEDPQHGSIEAWAVWQKSIHTAIDLLRRQSGAEQIVLIGLRLGATLAATVASQRDDVAAMVMLAPVLRGRSYINQLSVEAKLHDPSGQTDGSLVLHELHLSKQTVDIIREIDLRTMVLKQNCKVAVFAEAPTQLLTECAQAWGQSGASVTCSDFAGLEPMLRPVFMNHEPSANFERVTAWLRGMVPPSEWWNPRDISPQMTQLRLAPRLRLEKCVETPLRFGPSERLFGILCRPLACSEADLVVVIGNSSADPHSGFARIATNLARRLAEEGFASLRMDFAGIGDSLAEGDRPTHVFESDRREDFSAAIDALAARGYRRFALQGLCSGAYHAFQAAVADPRVGVLLLVNLPLFEWQTGIPVEYMSHVVESPSHFMQKLGRADLWQQLIRGELDVSNRLATQGVWFASKAKAATWRLAERVGFKPRPSFGRDAAQSLSHRARTLFLFAEGDAGVASFAQEFGPNMAPPGATLEILPGLDHALTSQEMQITAAKSLIHFLKQEPLSYMTEDATPELELAV